MNPMVAATKNRVRIASENAMPPGVGTASPTSRRMPSGAQPSASGSARTTNQPTGTMPTTNNAPSHGVPPASPWLSSSCLANGVITMPPTDNPVDATDRAIDRLLWNHRVTTVVAGTSPAAAHPAANTA
jgi:hypothetical protein